MNLRSVGVCLVSALSLPAAAMLAAPQAQPAKPDAKPAITTRPAATTRPSSKPEPAPPPSTTPKASPSDADPKWLEKLKPEDRAPLDDLVGWAPPSFTGDLKWLSGAGVTAWEALRGKVVVIQSFTTGTTAGRTWPRRVGESLKEHKPTDLRILALHTPEQAETAEEFLKKQKPPENVDVVIDSAGAFCDALGVYKQPVNIVIDRNGTVRFAGLNAGGLDKAVAMLVKEPFDHANKPSVKPAEAKPAKPESDFPPFTGAVSNAKDIRGKKAPEFNVQQFVTKGKPSLADKVVVVDFWATWCGPCRQAIPHMNALAERFGDKVCCIGVSDESKSNFEQGMTKYKLKYADFNYNLALDPSKSMYGAIGISAIPHCIVMSRDWVVRWQGHPASLDEETLEKIIKADGAGGGSSTGGGTTSGKRRGWTSG